MQRQDLKAFFGSYKAAAEAIGLTLGAVSNWKGKGIVPELRAREFDEVTGGKLKFRPELYRSIKVSRPQSSRKSRRKQVKRA